MLKFNVKNQIIERLDDFRVVADSRNYLTADFMLSDEWDDKKVYASFSHMDIDIAKEAEIKDGQCLVPWEVIKPPFFSVSLFCGDLITSNVVSVQVEASGLRDGEPAGTPTPTVWAQYVAEIERYAAELAAKVIGKQTPEGGVIFGDYDNNHALAPFTTATGNGCIAGMRGYYYSSVEFGEAIDEENYGPCVITLSDKQWKAPAEAFEIGYSVGDVISMVNNSKYPDCGTITAINQNVITVDKLPFNSIVDMIKKTGSVASDDYSVFVAEKPLAGDVPLGYGAFVSGESAIALERASAAFGRLTKALGQYGFAANRETIAAYCAAAFGHHSKALGFNSFAINASTKAKAKNSFAAGYATEASGEEQAVFGRRNIEDLINEFALIIGNGTSDVNRSNAFTVDWDGNVQCSGRIKAGDKDVATTEDIEKYMANTFATFKEIPLVAGITSELKIKPLYDVDADAFDVMVNDAALNNKTPINEGMRIATELLSAENTYIVFYSGEDIIYKCTVMRTIPNFGILFAV